VRVPSYAAVCLTALALAGCDGNGDDGPTWGGPPDPAADGSVVIDEFVELQAEVDERWERSAEMLAAEFLRLDERTATHTTIDGISEGEGEGPRLVTVTLDGLLDDSVRAERWMLVVEPGDEGYTLASAIRTLQCQPGRGHEEFTAEPCA
jgi:hypothetical protein